MLVFLAEPLAILPPLAFIILALPLAYPLAVPDPASVLPVP